MTNMEKKLKGAMAVISVLFCLACADKKDDGYNTATQGRISFELIRNNVYSISDLSEISTIKIWLSNAEGKSIELPSQSVSGTENLISTAYIVLDAGTYAITEYRCYDLQADLIEGLSIKPEKDNLFEIEAGTDTEFSLPIKVKQSLTTSNLYNTLRGICLEIVGPDESLWPKSWDFDSGEIDIMWAGLEFDTDELSNPTDVIGLVIDGSEQYITNSDTWEKTLVSLPEFRHMTDLPGCVSNLVNLQSLAIMNCDLEYIPDELQYSYINSLMICNTNLQSLPEELSNMKSLVSVQISGNRMTEFPECLTGISTMEIFTLENEDIKTIPESIANWGEKLEALAIRNTGISSLPDVFDKLWHVSMPDFSGNRNLSTLPQTLGLEKIPYSDGGAYSVSGITGINLNGCGFTAIPSQIQRAGIKGLYMADNRITSVTKEEMDNMPDLQTLVLDGNSLTSFPRLTNPNLAMLSLIGTGLERSQVDLSGMPQLNPLYVFFTQEDYDKVFGM